MSPELKKGLELSRKFAKNLIANLKQKAANNKKFAIFLLIVGVASSYIFISKVSFFEANAQKSYETKTQKMQENSDKLLKLKLNQKAQNLGIKPLHSSDSNISDYSQTAFSKDVKMQNITNNQILNFPKNKNLIVIHYKNGEKVYLFQTLKMQKIEE